MGRDMFPSSPSPHLSARPLPHISTVTAVLQSEQWDPGPPPRAGHPPRSRRDFGKEINTRWERAGLPGTHSPCAKSCWREWVRGPRRAGGARAPRDCSPRSLGPGSQPGTGTAREEYTQSHPLPSVPTGAKGARGRGHIPCAGGTWGGCQHMHPSCHPLLGHSPTIYPSHQVSASPGRPPALRWPGHSDPTEQPCLAPLRAAA